MAPGRFARPSVNWTAIAEHMRPAEKPAYLAFKAKSDGYLRKMSALPAAPPQIDWAAYRREIAAPGLVDALEKLYGAVKIPYPEDVYTATIDKLETETDRDIGEFKAEADAVIKKHETRIREIENMLPFGQMTFEDAAYVEPELVLDMENKPSFWPHEDIDRL
ncbi:ATP synthase, F0 complex, subunit D, mitochondrial [Cinara cedri]|uniref:ATP synthase subunit d, mitochondrial n=1 Tax=Cinara cedri TaxID=506608 RepID=A0A5E4M933_9HEMI|nr:ATP synthase, F0 complex, subunit D, mitochondrial [Cinara cedri]